VRIPDDLLTTPPPPGEVCVDCWRLPPLGQGVRVFLSREWLEMHGVLDLPPGWYVFCAGDAVNDCERAKRELEAEVRTWKPKSSGWPY
jgi:hypothetical protein